MEWQFLTDLTTFLREKFERFPGEGISITLERCPANMTGDFTINAFRFARYCGGPDAAAQAICDFAAAHPDIERADKVKGFVNLTVKAEKIYDFTLRDSAALLARAELPEERKRKILMEYSAPNTNKPQHLGHVRNNTIGMATASLLRRVGNTVFEINLVNDRGIHICKSMLAYERFGHGETPESTGIKGDHLVGNYYVKFNQELEKELAALKSARPELAGKSDEELFLETGLGAAARKMLQDWENGDEKVRALWREMNSWVFEGFAETYRRMGVKFLHTYLESQTYLLGKDIIASGLEKGVFTRRADGAVIADLGKLGQKVVLRSDGTSVYITQDLGTTLLKYNDYRPDTMIWVVGDEQILHFSMLFAILKKLGYGWADDLHHLSYGMVNLPSGKMKSREGTVVDADDLFDEMTELARRACAERGGEDLTKEELDRRAAIIGIGALKFMLLKFNAKTTIMFDPAASIRFEGDTGPYVQYVCARINSIGRKASERGLDPKAADWTLLREPAEKALAQLGYFYPEALRAAAEKMDCSGLVEYLLDLGKAFNRFYRECPVLSAEEPKLAAARLALSLAVRDILCDGLHTLTIEVPDAM